MPLLRAYILHIILGVLLTGIIYQNIRFSVRLDNGTNNLLAPQLVANVAGIGFARCALLGNQAFCFFGIFMLIEIAKYYGCAFAGEQYSGGSANATISAGYKSHFIF